MEQETIQDSLRKLESITQAIRPLIAEMPETLKRYRNSKGDPSEATRHMVCDIVELRSAVDGLTRVVLHNTQSSLLKERITESLDRRKWKFSRW